MTFLRKIFSLIGKQKAVQPEGDPVFDIFKGESEDSLPPEKESPSPPIPKVPSPLKNDMSMISKDHNEPSPYDPFDTKRQKIRIRKGNNTFIQIYGSKVYPSSDPEDLPWDTFICEGCGKTFVLRLYGSFGPRQNPDNYEKTLYEHVCIPEKKQKFMEGGGLEAVRVDYDASKGVFANADGRRSFEQGPATTASFSFGGPPTQGGVYNLTTEEDK